MSPVTSAEPPAAAAFALHAWVDESIHFDVPEVGGAMYILAAAVADPLACEPVRERLRDLVPKGRDRLHWNSEDAPLKRRVAATIGQADICGLVVVGVGADMRNQERARSKCMEALLFKLESLGVSQVWLEARTQTLNRRDLRLIDKLRGRKVITGSIRVDIAYPSEEPMLWIPDALAGATGMARKDVDDEFRNSMGDTIEEIRISISR